MVEHGHFADNEYQTKLSELHGGDKHYKPTMMPHGYFGVGEDEPKEPKEMPEETPNMVPPGHFAKVAAAVRDARLAKTFGTVKTQKEEACGVLDRVVELGRFVYEAEQTVESGIEGSGKAINGLLDVLCPLIGTRFPDAAKCMPSCDEMKERITKLSDPKFIGEVKTPKQKCENSKGRKVNFALLSGLTGSDLLFGTNFCPPLHEAGPSCNKNDLTIDPAATAAAAAPPPSDVKLAEKQVLQAEGLTWHQHQIKALEDEEDKTRLPVAPDMNSTQIECDRNCKIKKQLEKEAMEAALEKPFDVHQEKQIGEEVTTKEAIGGINSERSA
jgi:hypothetical protein